MARFSALKKSYNKKPAAKKPPDKKEKADKKQPKKEETKVDVGVGVVIEQKGAPQVSVREENSASHASYLIEIEALKKEVAMQQKLNELEKENQSQRV